MLKHSLKLTALAAATSLLLSACGGSDNDHGASPFVPNTVQGVAVDFYVGGATISLDDCDGLTTETNDEGKFNFTTRSEEHTSELQSRENLVCRLLLEKKKYK